MYRSGNTMLEPVPHAVQLMAFDDQLFLEVDPATVTWIH